MNLTENNISETRKQVQVQFSGEEVRERDSKIARDFMREANLPGFRPGKAPEPRVRMRYRKEIAQELQRGIISDALRKVVDDEGVKLYEVVKLDHPEPQPTPGEEAVVGITVDLTPEFATPEYEGVVVRKESEEPTEEAVEQEFQRILRMHRKYEEVQRAAAKGDYVKLTYEGRIGDQPIAEMEGVKLSPIWGRQENTWEEAGNDPGDGLAVPAVVDGVVGMSVGESRTVPYTFPEDHPVEVLRGKEAVYTLEALEVREPIDPEMNEEFFKSVGVANLEELRENLRKQIGYQLVERNQSLIRNQIIEHMLGQVSFALPESGVERYTQRNMERMMRRQIQAGGDTSVFEENKEQFYEQSRGVAERDLRLDLILERIAREREIELEREDLSNALMQTAMQNRVDPNQFVQDLQKDEASLNAFRRSVLMNKTLDFLVDKANVEESAG